MVVNRSFCCRYCFLLLLFLVVFADNPSIAKTKFIHNQGICKVFFSVRNAQSQPLYISTIDRISDQESPISFVTIHGKHSEAQFTCECPKIVQFLFGETKLNAYVTPGATILLSFDAGEVLNTVRFAGTNADINNYMIEKTVYQNSHIPIFKKLYSLNPTEFDSINNAALKYLKSLLTVRLKKSINFCKEENLDIKSYWLIKKLLYPGYHNYFSSDKVSSKPNDTLITSTIPLNAGYGALSKNYIEAITMYIDNRVREIPNNEHTLTDQQLFDLRSEEKIINSTINDITLKHLLVSRLMWKYLELGFIKTFQSHFVKGSDKYRFNLSYDLPFRKFEALKALDTGKIAPDFVANDLSNKPVKLSDLRGKYVFVNVWSLGCHFSLIQNSSLLEVQKSVRDQVPIVFLNINEDLNTDEVRHYLKTHELKGLNVNIPGINSDFNKKYFVTVTPRFILIDKMGRIMYSFANQPSSPDFLSQLNLLKI